MKKIGYIWLTCLIALFTRCGSSSSDRPCLVSDGNIIEQERAVASFHSIANYSAANVFVTQSTNNEYSVKMIGSVNILNILRTTVADGKLRIEDLNCFGNSHKLEIHIKLPNIASIEVLGSGNLIGKNSWITNALALTTRGSGDIDIETDATHITATIGGSGDIKLYGNSPTLDVENKGSGRFNSYGLYCKEAEAYTKGSGDVQIYATDLLRASVESSGNIYYRGYPVLEIHDSGSGSIFNDN